MLFASFNIKGPSHRDSSSPGHHPQGPLIGLTWGVDTPARGPPDLLAAA